MELNERPRAELSLLMEEAEITVIAENGGVQMGTRTDPVALLLRTSMDIITEEVVGAMVEVREAITGATASTILVPTGTMMTIMEFLDMNRTITDATTTKGTRIGAGVVREMTITATIVDVLHVDGARILGREEAEIDGHRTMTTKTIMDLIDIGATRMNAMSGIAA